MFHSKISLPTSHHLFITSLISFHPWFKIIHCRLLFSSPVGHLLYFLSFPPSSSFISLSVSSPLPFLYSCLCLFSCFLVSLHLSYSTSFLFIFIVLVFILKAFHPVIVFCLSSCELVSFWDFSLVCINVLFLFHFATKPAMFNFWFTLTIYWCIHCI